MVSFVDVDGEGTVVGTVILGAVVLDSFVVLSVIALSGVIFISFEGVVGGMVMVGVFVVVVVGISFFREAGDVIVERLAA